MYIHVMHLAGVAAETVPESLRISDMDTASVPTHITGPLHSKIEKSYTKPIIDRITLLP
jgi:hypothetical protein